MVKNNLRSYLSSLQDKKLLKELGEAETKFEVALFEKNTNSPIRLRPKGKNGYIVSNLIISEETMAIALGTDPQNVHDKFMSSVGSPKKISLNEADLKEYVKISDKNIPAVWHFENDLGYYMTSSIAIAQSPDKKILNASVHRIRLLGNGKGVIRMVEGRHLHAIWNMWKNAAKDMPVAIVIGVHPAVELAAAYQAPLGTFEMDIANSLVDGLEFYRSPEHGLPIPEAEFIIEGYISKDEKDSDSMVEMLGNYDHTRQQPVIRFEKIYSRNEPIYWDVLPGGTEHRWLMGFPVEAKLNKEVKSSVPSVKKVYLTEGGSKWLHAVIQIDKKLEGEPVNAMIAAFAAHPSLKLVIVVDDDIDPKNPVDVERAIATRFQASRGLLVIKNAKGSSLDPSSDQEMLLTDKLGIDATITLRANKERFKEAKIPGESKNDHKS